MRFDPKLFEGRGDASDSMGNTLPARLRPHSEGFREIFPEISAMLTTPEIWKRAEKAFEHFFGDDWQEKLHPDFRQAYIRL